MRDILLLASSLLVAACLAADGGGEGKPKRSELIRRVQMRQFGGLVQRPDSYRGYVVVANAGTPYGAEAETVIDSYKKNIRIRIEQAETERPSLRNASALREKTGAQAILFLTDDPQLPPLLVAPEERWATVNVAGLAADAATDAAARRRVRCEIARGLAYLTGAANSAFPNSLMTSVTAAKGLDAVTDEMPPAEVFARMPSYLRGLGVTPMVHVPYRTACEEGWAPAPTNEIQRAIWERVHAIPSRPMKIEFDPKKGR